MTTLISYPSELKVVDQAPRSSSGQVSEPKPNNAPQPAVGPLGTPRRTAAPLVRCRCLEEMEEKS